MCTNSFFLHWSALFSLVDFSGCASLFLLSTSLSSLFLPCLSCAISQQISFSLQHPFYPLRMLLYSPLVCFFLIYLIITIKLASLLPRILNVLCTNFQWLDDLEIPHKKCSTNTYIDCSIYKYHAEYISLFVFQIPFILLSATTNSADLLLAAEQYVAMLYYSATRLFSSCLLNFSHSAVLTVSRRHCAIPELAL